MIIESKDDVLSLSGSLHKNQWMTIKAAANLLLQDHPQGIIIDCQHLVEISGDGAKTFLDAMRDIEAAHARIIVAHLPENVLAVLKTIPGVRSQLPIATSVEEARASLRMASRANIPAVNASGKKAQTVLVPLLADVDLTYGAALAARVSRSGRHEVRLVYFMEVGRNLPLNAPMIEEEQAAAETLARAKKLFQGSDAPLYEHVEKVREASDGIMTAIKNYNAELLVFGAGQNLIEGEDANDAFHALVEKLLYRAPCEVFVGRMKAAG
jgi:anti-anti-sigma regulatory factor